MSERVTVQSKIRGLAQGAGRSLLALPSGGCLTQKAKLASPQWALALGGLPQAFESASHPGRALTVGEGSALSDLDNITVRIAHVAANLAVFSLRLRDELGSSTLGPPPTHRSAMGWNDGRPAEYPRCGYSCLLLLNPILSPAAANTQSHQGEQDPSSGMRPSRSLQGIHRPSEIAC